MKLFVNAVEVPIDKYEEYISLKTKAAILEKKLKSESYLDKEDVARIFGIKLHSEVE